MASRIMKLLLEHRDKYYPPRPPAPSPAEPKATPTNTKEEDECKESR